MKESGTSFQSLVWNQKHVRNVCHVTHMFIMQQYLSKFHFNSIYLGLRNMHKFNFHFVAMAMIMSQILRFVDVTKT